jgi:hypothetical protein
MAAIVETAGVGNFLSAIVAGACHRMRLP